MKKVAAAGGQPHRRSLKIYFLFPAFQDARQTSANRRKKPEKTAFPHSLAASKINRVSPKMAEAQKKCFPASITAFLPDTPALIDYD